jgi:hypothetical protein
MLIHGPEKVKKLYTLDKSRPTVVFVDDRANRVPRRAIRLVLAKEAERVILKEKLVLDMISADSAMLAAGNDRYDKPMPISEIGRAVHADVLIYATVDRFTLSPDGETYAPEIVLRVKVIDATNDARLWPDDEHGYQMSVKLPSKTATLPTSTAGRYQAEDELAKRAGWELAGLFYNHEPVHGPQGAD